MPKIETILSTMPLRGDGGGVIVSRLLLSNMGESLPEVRSSEMIEELLGILACVLPSEPRLQRLSGASWFLSYLSFLDCMLPGIPESDLLTYVTIFASTHP